MLRVFSNISRLWNTSGFLLFSRLWSSKSSIQCQTLSSFCSFDYLSVFFFSSFFHIQESLSSEILWLTTGEMRIKTVSDRIKTTHVWMITDKTNLKMNSPQIHSCIESSNTYLCEVIILMDNTKANNSSVVWLYIDMKIFSIKIVMRF